MHACLRVAVGVSSLKNWLRGVGVSTLESRLVGAVWCSSLTSLNGIPSSLWSPGVEHLILAVPCWRLAEGALVHHRLTASSHPESPATIHRHSAGERLSLWPVHGWSAILRNGYRLLLVVSSLLRHATLPVTSLRPSGLWVRSLRVLWVRSLSGLWVRSLRVLWVRSLRVLWVRSLGVVNRRLLVSAVRTLAGEYWGLLWIISELQIRAYRAVCSITENHLLVGFLGSAFERSRYVDFCNLRWMIVRSRCVNARRLVARFVVEHELRLQLAEALLSHRHLVKN